MMARICTFKVLFILRNYQLFLGRVQGRLWTRMWHLAGTERILRDESRGMSRDKHPK